MADKILKLNPGREKSLKNKHPWVFSGAVQKKPSALNGEVVKVVSAKDEFLGYGFYSSQSQISCRVFEFKEFNGELLNAEYWKNKISHAYRLRKQLVFNSQTNAFRLIHAEGDFFPGLIIDIYNEVAVIQVLVKGVEKIIDIVIESLKSLGFNLIYLNNPGNKKNIEEVTLESGWLEGKAEGKVEVLENGLKFRVDVEEGQKTGFFLDQRDNRSLLGRLSEGKKVLNTFSYTGGFSVYALKGKCKEVHSVDISEAAIKAADENVSLNFRNAAHKSFTVDCFDYLRKMEEVYDVIVLDPPAFAKNAHAVNQAAKGYKDINLQAIKKINKEGLIFTFSCSHHISRDLFRKIVFGAASDAQREVRVIYELSQPPDHPINIYHPEGEYLKGLVIRVD